MPCPIRCQLKNMSLSSLYFICFFRFLVSALLVFCISLASQCYNDYLLASNLRVLSLCWSWVQRLLCPGAFGGSVRDPRTRLLVVMARAEEQPGPAHWPCWLSHSPLLLMLAPICTERSVQMGLHSCLSAYCCCCLPAPSCVKALHMGHSCRLLKPLVNLWVTHAISLMPKTTKCVVARSKLMRVKRSLSVVNFKRHPAPLLSPLH